MSLPPNIHQVEPPVENEERASLSIMYRETNIHSIRALEKQIEEGNGDIIKLKRARNSLLNISTRMPPEILGYIFVWSLVREVTYSLHSPSHFRGLLKGSFNFLLVCHHWFEVASRTPELWGFWGNTLGDWRKRYQCSGTAPLDLVLDGDKCDLEEPFDAPLQRAVRDRVMQGTIRQVHLSCVDRGTLASIISALTPDGEGVQNETIESIILRDRGIPPMDVSEFFARSRLSKLCTLDVSGNFQISSWDCLTSRTTLLTTLSLEISQFSPSTALTTSQLFSILASNPNLQQLMLSDVALPFDIDRSTFQVPLLNLSMLTLTGDFGRLFALLRQLILPETLDGVLLTGFDCTVEDISRILGPYMRNYFRRDARFQDRLGICSFTSRGSISISVNAVCDHAVAPAPKPPIAVFTVVLADLALPHPPEKFLIDLIALIPQTHVVSFNANSTHHMKPPEELFSMMPDIETLYLSGVEVSEGFLQPNPEGPHANTKLLPSLRSLHLEDVTLGDDWGHLTMYLAHQTSDDQSISLEVFGDSPYMCPEVVNEIKGLVEEFAHDKKPEAVGMESPCSICRSTHGEDEQ